MPNIETMLKEEIHYPFLIDLIPWTPGEEEAITIELAMIFMRKTVGDFRKTADNSRSRPAHPSAGSPSYSFSPSGSAAPGLTQLHKYRVQLYSATQLVEVILSPSLPACRVFPVAFRPEDGLGHLALS